MSRSTRSIALALLLLAPLRAVAQEDTLPPGPVLGTPATAPATRSAARTGVIVGATATLLPVVVGLATASYSSEEYGSDSPLPALLAVGGLVLGPAIGDWSAGLTGRGFSGIAMRGLLGGGVVVAGAALGWDCDDDCGGALAVMGVGGLFVVGHAIWDIATIPRAVEKRARRTVSVMPVYVPATGTPGLGVHVGF